MQRVEIRQIHHQAIYDRHQFAKLASGHRVQLVNLEQFAQTLALCFHFLRHSGQLSHD
jgi:hypothetical protein